MFESFFQNRTFNHDDKLNWWLTESKQHKAHAKAAIPLLICDKL